MKEFKTYYSDERIISYICRIRVSYAQKRNKKHLLNNLTSKNNHKHLEDDIDNYDRQILEELNRITPKRRLWLTLDKNAIYEKGKRIKSADGTKSFYKRGDKLNSIKKNEKCLYYTIKKYRKQNPEMQFVEDLNTFIKSIQESIESNDYVIGEPSILPEPKETNRSRARLELKQSGVNECRPIARFKLKDRIILSITNKFLTRLFDKYFEESALAFRAVNFVNGKPIIKNHHTAIEGILEYKKGKYQDVSLNVAECDMKKFYDSVNHKICMNSFYQLIARVKADNINIDLEKVTNVFEAYLKCYSFQDNVLILNKDNDVYWEEKKVQGRYPWIEKDIEASDYYKKNTQDRIGVPQGGALSGLIANIVLDDADKALKEVSDLFYVRYCDDMVLIHPDKQVCKDSIDKYVKMVNEKLLFTHPFKLDFIENDKDYSKETNVFQTRNNIEFNRKFEKSTRTFWKGKSKGPYLWGPLDLDQGVFPWIGFVGYEVKYSCETRVRIRSLKKEIEKQKKTVFNIIKVIKKQKVIVNNAIIRSAYEKLNGMSVGRVEMYNYKFCRHEMCWAVGFKNLNLNKYSKRQLKILDKQKYRCIHKVKKSLGPEIINPKKKGDEEDSNYEIVKYHKPYSYYYQAGERKGPPS